MTGERRLLFRWQRAFELVRLRAALVRLDVTMRGSVLAAMACVAMTVSGCGGVYYAVSVNAAQARLEQAREMGAESAAPYEYYYAREHLREAQRQAAEASYGDAANFAETAEVYAQKAIDAVTAAKHAEGQK